MAAFIVETLTKNHCTWYVQINYYQSNIWERCVENLRKLYNHGETETAGLLGICWAFRQHIPSNPAKYGKIWTRCYTETSSASILQLITGKEEDAPPGKNQGV